MARMSPSYTSPTLHLGSIATFADVVKTWRRRSRERHELGNLGARTLHDIGLNAGQVAFEANKPFWRA
ncbi:MAG: DUF1127 domain-containing protein [Enhydrobacter sp.]|nr:MAG: DUF1127 domain-containing protein [Enhydrobacter sp.]